MCNVEILTGPPGSGKTQFIIHAALPAIQEHRCREILILVPSILRGEEIQEGLLLQQGIQGFLGLKILTFLDLCVESFQDSALPGRIITPLVRTWMVQAILSDQPLQYLEQVREARGFIDLTADLIRTLKEGCISCETFLKWARSNGASARLLEIAEVYQEYETRRRARNLLDPEDLFLLAAEQIRRNTAGPFSSLRSLLVTGFYDFTSLQIRLLSALSGCPNMEQILLTLTHQKDSGPAGRFTRRTLDRLMHLWPDAKIKTLAPATDASGPPFHHLSRFFLTGSEDAPRMPAKGSIRILRTPGSFREVEEIARKIRGLQQDQGYSFRDAAVVFRNLNDVQDKIREVFRFYDIPFQMSSGLPLISNPLIRVVMQILQIPLSGYRRDAVIGLLRSEYIRFDPLIQSPVSPERIDILSREAMIQGGKEEWRNRIASRIQDLDIRMKLLESGNMEGEDIKRIEEKIRKLREKISDYQECIKIIEKLFSTVASLPLRAPLTLFTDILKELIKTFHLQEQVYACTDLRLIRRDQMALKRFQELLRQMILDHETIHVNREIPLSEFMRILNLTLSDTNYSPDLPQQDAVLVTDAPGMRGLRRPVVFIGGLVEEVFPRGHPANPIFGEKDRIRLNQSLAPDQWVPLAAHWREEEDILFLLSATSAVKILFLTCPRADAQGMDLLPSRYMDRVQALFEPESIEETVITLNHPLPDSREIFREKELLEYTFRHLALPVSENREAPALFNLLIKTRPERISPLLHGLGIIQARGQGADAYSGMLGPEAATLLRNQETHFSATALEHYGVCPFKYFCEQELRIQPIEEVEDEIGAMDIGSLYHKILQLFYTEHQRQIQGPVTPENLEPARQRMHKIIDGVLSKAEIRGVPGHQRIWEIRKQEVHQVLDRFLQQEADEYQKTGEVPSHFEVCFGMPPYTSSDPLSTREPLIFDAESGPIRLMGKVDRIDLCEHNGRPAFSIVDYKSGKSAPGYGEIQRGESLQIPVYAAWAKSVFSNQREMRYGFLYLLRTGEKKRQIETEKHPWDEVMETTLKHIREYVEAIRQGKFPVTQNKCPDYCELSPVCRIREG